MNVGGPYMILDLIMELKTLSFHECLYQPCPKTVLAPHMF